MRYIEDLSSSINDNAFDWTLAQISLSVHSNIIITLQTYKFLTICNFLKIIKNQAIKN